MEATLIKSDSKVGIQNSYFVPEVLRSFIKNSLPGFSHDDISWYATNDYTYVKEPDISTYGIGNLQAINGLRRINKHFEAANATLKEGQFFITCLESQNQRMVRILQKYPKVFNQFIYVLDFIIHRVFSKIKYTKKLYFAITKGEDRVLSLTEALGRLSSCGFQIINYQKSGYKTYILVRKISTPKYDLEPTYGALVKMKRVGYQGKRILLYKLRTMHPYSEYLQEYMFNEYGTKDGDKVTNDFRVTTWGKIFRKLWIDELPMLWNWLKRDLKLVGVRPLSEHKFSTYPEYLQEKRIQVKPGLVPPYYADLPQNLDEFFESEERYLDSYIENPIRTDIKYFFQAMYNIFIKKARSA